MSKRSLQLSQANKNYAKESESLDMQKNMRISIIVIFLEIRIEVRKTLMYNEE